MVPRPLCHIQSLDYAQLMHQCIQLTGLGQARARTPLAAPPKQQAVGALIHPRRERVDAVLLIRSLAPVGKLAISTKGKGRTGGRQNERRNTFNASGLICTYEHGDATTRHQDSAAVSETATPTKKLQQIRRQRPTRCSDSGSTSISTLQRTTSATGGRSSLCIVYSPPPTYPPSCTIAALPFRVTSPF